MTTSGTYTFSLDNGGIILEAFDRCGIRPTALTHEHFTSARNSINLELQSWSNKGINLWAVDLIEAPLIAGTSTYTLTAETDILLDVYIATAGNPTGDRILMPIGRSDYAAYPDKVTPGFPTVFWFERLMVPRVTVWQPPDDTFTYTLKMYRMRRLQDANPTMGETPDAPARFLDALCAAMARRLARKYAPSLVADLKVEALEALADARGEDRERAPISISPDLSGYWRV